MVNIKSIKGTGISKQIKRASKCVNHIKKEASQEGTELPSIATPIIKNQKIDKAIVEGNIKDRIKNLDILNNDKELDKMLNQYRADVDKCELAASYEEYSRSIKLVDKKWQLLFNKIEELTTSSDKAVSEKANIIFEQKFMPAMLYLQEMFSKMDNTEMVKKAFFK